MDENWHPTKLFLLCEESITKREIFRPAPKELSISRLNMSPCVVGLCRARPYAPAFELIGFARDFPQRSKFRSARVTIASPFIKR